MRAHRRPRFSAQAGFTMIEVLLSLSLVSLLAVLMLPMIVQDVGTERILGAYREATNSLVLAYGKLSRRQLPGAGTTAQDIVLQSNYVRLISDGSQTIQLSDDGATTSTCSAQQPCALMQGGALVQFKPTADFSERVGTPAFPVPRANVQAVMFNVDPDGSGSQPAVTVYLYFNGRLGLTNPDQGQGQVYDSNAPLTAVSSSNITPSTAQPEYMAGLLDG